MYIENKLPILLDQTFHFHARLSFAWRLRVKLLFLSNSDAWSRMLFHIYMRRVCSECGATRRWPLHCTANVLSTTIS